MILQLISSYLFDSPDETYAISQQLTKPPANFSIDVYDPTQELFS